MNEGKQLRKSKIFYECQQINDRIVFKKTSKLQVQQDFEALQKNGEFPINIFDQIGLNS